MPAPCRRCGATKTEPVHHGFSYHLAEACGYRLRKCSRCRRRRILPERAFVRPKEYSAALQSTPQAQAGAPPTSAQWDAASFDPDGFDGCPRCGNASFDRAPRNWLERSLGLAHMARCRACGKRFAYPQP